MDDERRTSPEEPEETVEAAGSDPGQNIGVYLLDAATPEERTSFEQAVEALPEVRAEAVRLAPVAMSLGRVYDLNPDQIPAAYDVSAVPSGTLKGRVLTSVVPSAPMDQAGPAKPIRPQGRVRGGAPARGEPIPIRGWRTPWAAVAALIIVAAGITLWALSIQNKYDDQSREVAAQSTEIAMIRATSNASAYTLTATGDLQANAAGTLFYSSKDQQAALMLSGMPAITDNSVYQIWYIKGSSAPAPGATFQPNADGTKTMPLTPSLALFDSVAVTHEKAGGSTTPTMPILLTGTASGAAG